jgi:hypothetical protein
MSERKKLKPELLEETTASQRASKPEAEDTHTKTGVEQPKAARKTPKLDAELLSADGQWVFIDDPFQEHRELHAGTVWEDDLTGWYNELNYKLLVGSLRPLGISVWQHRGDDPGCPLYSVSVENYTEHSFTVVWCETAHQTFELAASWAGLFDLVRRGSVRTPAAQE